MTDQAPVKQCRTCACYQPHALQVGVGFCFCMPPSAVPVRQPDGSMGVVAAFPPVTPDNWCFQWRAREEPADLIGRGPLLDPGAAPARGAADAT